MTWYNKHELLISKRQDFAFSLASLIKDSEKFRDKCQIMNEVISKVRVFNKIALVEVTVVMSDMNPTSTGGARGCMFIKYMFYEPFLAQCVRGPLSISSRTVYMSVA